MEGQSSSQNSIPQHPVEFNAFDILIYLFISVQIDLHPQLPQTKLLTVSNRFRYL